MALKIRCPHCQLVLLAEDWTAGEGRFCPGCNKGFTVPLPRRAAAATPNTRATAASAPGQPCARCGAALAPGTTACRHCLSDPRTGARLPLRQRLRHVSRRFWATLAASVVFLGLAGYAVTYLVQLRQRDTQPTNVRSVAPHTGADWTKPANELLTATTNAVRAPLRQKLLLNATQAGPPIADGLEAALRDTQRAREQIQRSRCAALEVLGETGDARWSDLLRRCQEVPALRDAAIRARAQVGDAAVLGDATNLWMQRLRETIFLERAAELVAAGDDAPGAAASQIAALRDAARRKRDAQNGLTTALRRLGPPAIERLVPYYWVTWNWLGQARGEAVAAGVFELAKPDPRTDGGSTDPVAQIRGARRTLEQVAHSSQNYATRAAIVLTLAQNVPQYQSLRDRLLEGLIGGLAEPDAQTQQRIVWTLAKLNGRSFGPVSAATHPAFIDADGVNAAGEWARSVGLLNKPVAPFGAAERRRPPTELARRVLTPQRQLEEELLPAFGMEAAAVRDALKQWSEARLGFTARIEALLNPAQRSPNVAGLLGAMAIAAEIDPAAASADPLRVESIRKALAVWRDARDQTALVRFAANTALVALPGGASGALREWPGATPLAASDVPDTATLEILGRIVAAGGPRMLAAIDNSKLAGIAGETRAALARSASLLQSARSQK